MKSFLEKLDRTANRFMAIMDNEMQQPIVQTLTGEVFTHDPTSQSHHSQEQSTQPIVQTSMLPTKNLTRDSRAADKNVLCPPRLQPAGAHKK